MLMFSKNYGLFLKDRFLLSIVHSRSGLGVSAKDRVKELAFHLKRSGRGAAKKSEHNEYLSSRFLLSVQSVGATGNVRQGAVMPEVCVAIPKLNRFLRADAVSLSS